MPALSRVLVRRVVLAIVVLLGLGVAAAPALAAKATPRVLGGVLTGNGRAPFMASVATGQGLCTAVIIAPRRVLTAAHCVSRPKDGQVPADTINVRAGVVNREGDNGQTVGVAEVRRHPGFVQDIDEVQPDDIAELRLATPLSFNGEVAAIAPAPAPATGEPLTLYGYGAQGTGAGQNDGKLRRAAMSTVAPESCSAFNAIQVCYVAPDASTCPGDSGGPVTALRGDTEVLVAINNGGSCLAGKPGIGAQVGAPEIGRFVDGDDSPPSAPRPGTTGYDGFFAVVGQPLTCRADGFSGSPPLTTSAVFFDQDSGVVVQGAGAPAHLFTDADVGRRIGCRVSVSNAGGTFRAGPLRTQSPVVALRLPGLGLRISDSLLRLSGSTDATGVTLTTTDAAGRVRKQLPLGWPSSTVPRPKLSTGRYAICLDSPKTVFYAAGRACLPHVVSGRFKSLTSKRRSARRGSRFSFSFRVDPRAARVRVKVVHRISRRGQRTRRVSSRLTLRGTTRFRSPSVPRGGRLRTVVILPRRTIDGVPYTAGSLVFTRRQRG